MLAEDLNYSVKLPSSGVMCPLRVRRSARAKRLNLKIDTVDHVAELVLPHGMSTESALGFAQKNAGWIERHLGKLPNKNTFEIGAKIPFLGKLTELAHSPNQRGISLTESPLENEEQCLSVGGPEIGFQRRVERFFKTQSRKKLTDTTKDIAAEMRVNPKAIRLKDTKTRWGSCSSAGAINYSWRLIFAPKEVLRYVVVHECAHLIEMNHSAAFWAIVETHDPHWREHRLWLKENGASLHAIG